MNLNEFFDHLDEVKKFAPGVYTHQPKGLTVMPTQDKTLWADAGELPKEFNVTQMNISIYDEEDDNDPYSYGNTGLEVFHDAGTWQMYTDDTTEQQISDYLGVKVSFSEQGMQNEKFMHFDISDEAVAQLIDKGAFKMTKAESVDEAHEMDRADKMVLAKLMDEYENYKEMVAGETDRDDKKMYKERLRDVVSMIKYVQGKKLGIDTALEDELSDMYDEVKGVKEDAGDDALAKEIAKLYDYTAEYIEDSRDNDEGEDDEESLRTGYDHDDLYDAENLANAFRKDLKSGMALHKQLKAKQQEEGREGDWDPFNPEGRFHDEMQELLAKHGKKINGIKESNTPDVDRIYPGTGDIYGYSWDCRKCGAENEFSLSRQAAQEYIDDWEKDNEDLVADGETGSGALDNLLELGEDSGFHWGTKCVKCGTVAEEDEDEYDDSWEESVNDIIRLSGIK